MREKNKTGMLILLLTTVKNLGHHLNGNIHERRGRYLEEKCRAQDRGGGKRKYGKSDGCEELEVKKL